MSAWARRITWRSVVILLAAALVGLALYALAQTPLAAQLAIDMNVSEPLIALNDLVQGAAGGAGRGRDAFGFRAGLNQVERDLVVLAVVAAIAHWPSGWRGGADAKRGRADSEVGQKPPSPGGRKSFGVRRFLARRTRRAKGRAGDEGELPAHCPSNDFASTAGEHDDGAFSRRTLKEDAPCLGLPHVGDERFARVEGLGEARLDAFEARGVVITKMAQEGATCEAVGAEAVQNGTWEAGGLCHSRVGVYRVAVAAEAIEQCLIGCGAFAVGYVGRTLGRLVLFARRAAFAAITAETANEQ